MRTQPLASLAALLVLAACSAPLAPEALPHTESAAVPVAPVAPEADWLRDPLARAVPVVRVVAGQADTLVVQDWMGAGAAPVFGSHPDVTVEASGERLVIRAREGFSGHAAVPYTIDGEPLALPVTVAAEPEVTFTFAPDLSTPEAQTAGAPAPRVFVMGGFNDWSRTSDELTDRGDGTFALTRSVAPGRYEYKLVVDGAEVLDATNPDTAPNPFGDFNNILTVDAPGDGSLLLRLIPSFASDQIEFEAIRTDRAGAPMDIDLEPEDVIALIGNAPIPQEAMEVHGTEVLIGLQPLPGMPDLRGHRTLRVAASVGGVASEWRELLLFDGLPLAQAQGLPRREPLARSRQRLRRGTTRSSIRSCWTDSPTATRATTRPPTRTACCFPRSTTAATWPACARGSARATSRTWA